MPNLRLEYSDNLDLNSRSLFCKLHQALAATNGISLKGLRSQATQLTDYYIADGHEGYQHIMVTLSIAAGRPFELRQTFARTIMSILEDHFGHLRETSRLSLMVDVQEMEKGILHIHHNISAEGWQGTPDGVDFIMPLPETAQVGP